jgi:signal transduction histidine kinase
MPFLTAAPARGWHVIIIDDSPDDRAEVRRLLLRGSERRYVFREAATGAAGVEAVQAAETMPDCVVLDFNLPDMDALDVLAGLAGPDGLPICPVVVLTGGTELEAGRSVLRAGAQDYISKDGLTPLALARIVENAIERLAMSRELLVHNAALLRSEKILSEADRRKDEFIATLAHELRNPLAPVSAGLQVLRMTNDPGLLQRTLDIMERQLNQMTRLVDDLLDVSRITSGKVLLRLERVLVNVVVEAAVEAARPVISAGYHTLKVDLPRQPLWLEVDAARLAQVIGNLLNNSAKYSGYGTVITLSACRDGDGALIQVTDEGLGIPKDMLGHVFEMFTQVNSNLERAQGGLGIGLALVKQLVEMHGGTVLAESAGAGQGSTFSIRLPLAAAVLEVKNDVKADLPTSPSSRRILIVDDNVDGALMLAMMLDLSGHVTRTAFTGQEALATGAEFSPEIIFLDIGLPGMNGYEVAKQFRTIPSMADVLLVALTGWGGEEDRRKSKEAGFDRHLTKPIGYPAINALLAQFEAPGSDRLVVE